MIERVGRDPTFEYHNGYGERYTRYLGKAVAGDKLMSLAFDPHDGTVGAVRKIVSRSGIPGKDGLDRSELWTIEPSAQVPSRYVQAKPLTIANAASNARYYCPPDSSFLGPEDLHTFREGDRLHAFFTFPYWNEARKVGVGHLAHAVGSDMNHLEMDGFAMRASYGNHVKEPLILPTNQTGVRHAIVESSVVEDGVSYSVMQAADATNLQSWTPGKILLHPKQLDAMGGYWAAQHVSPGPLLGKGFADPGEGKYLALVNTRGADRMIAGSIPEYGKWTISVAQIDAESLNVDHLWPPLLSHRYRRGDSAHITFAAEFKQIDQERGIIYLHDDYNIYAYEISTEGLADFLLSHFHEAISPVHSIS